MKFLSSCLEKLVPKFKLMFALASNSAIDCHSFSVMCDRETSDAGKDYACNTQIKQIIFKMIFSALYNLGLTC